MKSRYAIASVSALLAFAAVGCVREPVVDYASSPQVAKLSANFQDQIRAILEDKCGTPTEPKLLGEPGASAARLKLGAAVYAHNCRQCHGVTGDGAGPAAAYLLPKPRDYRPGIFKFTSTTYGSKPLREDLVRTVRRGVAGTSMPSFRLLPDAEMDAVIDYVLALTHRGELESQLADAAEFDNAVDAKAVPAMIETVVGKWTTSKAQVVYPVTPQPVFTKKSVDDGKQAFLTKGCSKCHGEDGRGQTKENIGVDAWNNPTKAADLTSGMLRGGPEPLDIYRHIDAGINGTPMPSFSGTLRQEPETMWNLTAYVLHMSNSRRKGAIPEAGMLKPLPGVEEKAAAPAPAAAQARPAPAPADGRLARSE